MSWTYAAFNVKFSRNVSTCLWSSSSHLSNIKFKITKANLIYGQSVIQSDCYTMHINKIYELSLIWFIEDSFINFIFMNFVAIKLRS